MSTSHQAEPAATPSRKAELRYSLQMVGSALDVVNVETHFGTAGGHVLLKADYGPLSFFGMLRPEMARQLAVYLVDCANALDNPAARVIADDVICTACTTPRPDCMGAVVPGIGDKCGALQAGEGIGHE